MIRRYLEALLRRALRVFPVVILTGPRQAGKSTLARALVDRDWPARYLSLDEPHTMEAALRDPYGLLADLDGPAILDEVQKAPDLLRAVKLDVDRERRPGRYVLTGSAHILDVPKAAETLAGRAALFELFPLAWSEIEGVPAERAVALLDPDAKTPAPGVAEFARTGLRAALDLRLLRGGYPEPAQLNAEADRRKWFDSYRQTYVERDVRSLAAIERLADFHQLLRVLASHTGRLLNLSSLSRDAGLPFATLHRYVALLELTYQAFRLHPYFRRTVKRLVKTPKLYFQDTGMACALLGLETGEDLRRRGEIGPLLETWVAGQLRALLPLAPRRTELFFWRTSDGYEVDFVLEAGDDLVGIEVKWGDNVRGDDLKGLEQFYRAFGKRVRRGWILYTGASVVPFDKRTAAVPLDVFFGLR